MMQPLVHPAPSLAARGRSRSRVGARGYTIVELLMAVCVFGIGVMGIIAMQKVTSTSNRHAKNLATATAVAESWIEHLSVDATRWTQIQDRLVNTVWLKGTLNNWLRPDFSVDEGFGPAFDALGQPLDQANIDQTVFCTHVRLVQLINEVDRPGNGLMRVDVRVFWPRDGEPQDQDYCGDSIAADTIGEHPEKYHFVYKSTAVRQTPN